MASEHAIRLSKAHEETNRRLMKKRRELTDAVFKAAKQQLQEFASRKDYAELLKKKAADLAQLDYAHVVFYVAQRDQAVLKHMESPVRGNAMQIFCLEDFAWNVRKKVLL